MVVLLLVGICRGADLCRQASSRPLRTRNCENSACPHDAPAVEEAFHDNIKRRTWRVVSFGSELVLNVGLRKAGLSSPENSNNGVVSPPSHRSQRLSPAYTDVNGGRMIGRRSRDGRRTRWTYPSGGLLDVTARVFIAASVLGGHRFLEQAVQSVHISHSDTPGGCWAHGLIAADARVNVQTYTTDTEP